jgi:hypothetical protein
MAREPNHPYGFLTVEHVAAVVAQQIAATSSYFEGGKHLSAFLFSVLPDGVDPDDWDARCEGFIEAINGAGGSKVKRALAWLDRNLRKVMRSVPAWRRREFASGVISVWERDETA